MSWQTCINIYRACNPIKISRAIITNWNNDAHYVNIFKLKILFLSWKHQHEKFTLDFILFIDNIFFLSSTHSDKYILCKKCVECFMVLKQTISWLLQPLRKQWLFILKVFINMRQEFFSLIIKRWLSKKLISIALEFVQTKVASNKRECTDMFAYTSLLNSTTCWLNLYIYKKK